ncbi:MAG: type II secretion system protein [Patescibacteria group bacterium]
MKQYGFTLVEVLVSMMIFSVIMLVSVSSFVYALDLQRRAFNLQQAEENANFILESITKELRVSAITSPLADSCPVATLVIQHPDHGEVEYSLVGTDIHRKVGETDTIMNSNTVKFSRFDFCVAGATTKDSRQPRVMIRLSLTTTNTNRQASVDLQTTLSLRELSN